MATLYDLVKEIENFDLQIDEETGELLNIDELDALQLEKDAKVENICLWIKNLKSDAEAYRTEKKAFEQKIRAAENKAARLTAYVDYILAGEKFKTSKVNVSYRKSEKVKCVDMLLVDPEYLKFATPELDKKKVKDDLKAGVKVHGCYLEQSLNVQIK